MSELTAELTLAASDQPKTTISKIGTKMDREETACRFIFQKVHVPKLRRLGIKVKYDNYNLN